ncbi:MAG: hypothetical protein ABSF56_02070 [Minisyncoccia bacterium]|jgi:GNAT superfamily N-acetyltransferase
MSTDFIYKKDDPAAFWKYWEEYIKNADVGPRYTRLSQENFLEMSATMGLLQADRSFVYVPDGHPAGIAFVPIEKKGSLVTISFYGTYTIAPLFANDNAAKKIFSAIDLVAREEKVDKIMFYVDPLNTDVSKYDLFQRFGYLNASILGYLIDLTLPGDLLRHCRKGHVSNIKDILKNKDYEIFYTDKAAPSYELHEEYRLMHHKAAGRATRSKQSFDSQFEKLKAGQAVLFGVRFKGAAVVYSYFEMYGAKGLYASSADDPDYKGLPVSHALMLRAMEYLRDLGVKSLDVDRPASPSAQFDYYPDEKQLAIGRFKRGFGGTLVDCYRGVKYLSKEAFEADVETFRKEYWKLQAGNDPTGQE